VTVASKYVGPSVYTRPTSGLVKAIGTFGAILFGVHCISLSSSGYIPFSWVASSWPGASIIGLLSVSMILSLMHGYTFAAIGIAMPRSGADYVLASRTLSPMLAFVASWTLVVFSAVVVGGLIAWIPKSAIPALLQPIGIIFGNSKFVEWANWADTTSGILWIGSAGVLLTLGLMLLPTRAILRFMTVGLFLGLAAWAIIYYSLLSAHGPQQFIDSWNRFVGNMPFGSFQDRIDLARKAGMTLNRDGVTMTLAGLIMGFWIFYGYYIPTFFAGEVRGARTSATLLIASWSSIIITGGIFIVAAKLLQRLVPLEWIAAEGFISNNPDAVEAVAGRHIEAFPWITFYAAILKPNAVLVFFTAFAWIYTLINLAQTYFFYASRIVFAWAFDRIVPEALAAVSERSGTPTLAVLSIAVLAEIGVVDAAYSGPLSTQLTFAFFAVVTQLLSVFAITIFPFKRPDLYRLCPGFVRSELFGFPTITIVGSLTLLYLVWMIYAMFKFPAVGIASPEKTLILLGILVASGFTVFIVARWYRHAKEGIDISLVYTSVPPE
jgi:APA family basic amino acid/polyamine antiporter